MCVLSEQVTHRSRQEDYWSDEGAVNKAKELFLRRKKTSKEIDACVELCSTHISASHCARAKMDIFSGTFFRNGYRTIRHYLEALRVARKAYKLSKARRIELTVSQVETLATTFMIIPMLRDQALKLIYDGISRCESKLKKGVEQDTHKARLYMTLAHCYELMRCKRRSKSYVRQAISLAETHIETIDPLALLRVYRKCGALRCRLEHKYPIGGLSLLKKALVIAVSLNSLDAVTKIAYEIRKWEPDFKIK